MNNENGRWITTETGAHVFIEDGKSVEEAIREAFGYDMNYEDDLEPELYRTSYWIYTPDGIGRTISKEQYDNAESLPWWKSGYRKEIKKETMSEKDFLTKTGVEPSEVIDQLNTISENDFTDGGASSKRHFINLLEQKLEKKLQVDWQESLVIKYYMGHIIQAKADEIWDKYSACCIEEGKQALSKYSDVNGDVTYKHSYDNTNKRYHDGNYPRQYYHSNCQRCVATFEARMRGKNVMALPLMDNNDNLQRNEGYLKCFVGGIDALEDNRDGHMGKVGKTVGNHIKQKVLDSGNGSRFILKVVWAKCNTGHVINIVNDNGKVRCIDAQSGIDYEDNYHGFGAGRIQPLLTELTRVDNLEFNGDVDKYFEEYK